VALPARAELLSDADVLAILKDRVDDARQAVGLVACWFDGGKHRIAAYGQPGHPKDRALDGDTVFEIGSITKVFTALLLTEMVMRGEVALDDPVAKYLPASVTMPSRNGRQITLLDLATYTSGLPRMPDNMPAGSVNPFATYTTDQLYAFLSTHALRFEPGTRYEYSNLGFGLLGDVLARRAGTSYEDLLVARVCTPLGLNDTRITLTDSMRQRLALGHANNLSPASNWDFPTLAGTGALRSTANDMMKFVRATCFAEAGAPLGPAIELLLKTRRPTNAADTKVGLGWFLLTGNDDVVVSKDGMTGGYAAFVAFSTRLKSGAVVLSNAANSVNDIGLHLANPAFSIAQYPPVVDVDPGVLASYEGVYRLSPKFTLTIRASSGRLFVRGTGQPEFELFPESNNRFFMRVVDAQGTFLRNKDGAVDRLLWHQGGRYRYCPRES
jgi:CubicO group peptidase (beta-lactamase class C family)